MRKTKKVTITEDNRDKGKTFVLTEMPARQAEKWATRALLALSRAGIEVPDDIASLGLRGVAIIGLRGLAGANFYDLEPLLDEMLVCARIEESAVARSLTEDDVEEVSTLLRLRKEVLGLHWDFFTSANIPT